MPWYLGWNELERITPDAVALLDGLFGSLCDEAVSLRFDGEDRLVRALRVLTPSGEREVAQSFWDVRLNALRAMHLQDDFELASLDYCVTYGASPPAWVDARCSMELSNNASGARDVSDRDAVTQPGWLEPERPPVALVLQGQLMGDTAQALSSLEAAGASGKLVVISCRDLIRVDFAAAGSILNWVTLCHAEGKQVQFLDVHRLVAAFFNVIGINERAKVLLRSM
jgi:anti-anti-sigma regulatory factor